METKDDSLKSQIAIRCAKAAVLLSCLKTSQNCNLRATIDYGNEVKIAFSTSLLNLRICNLRCDFRFCSGERDSEESYYGSEDRVSEGA